jgi:hypothetical protein
MSETHTPAAAELQSSQTVTPDLFDLTGAGLHVNYSTTGIDGKPHFLYQNAHQTLGFRGDEIHIADLPDIGTIVSVIIARTVDQGSTTFSLLLPHVNLPAPSAPVPIHTDGITTHHAFSVIPAFNQGQRDTYTLTELHGTASYVVF